MVSRTKLTLLTAAVVVPLILIVLSMSLALADDGGLDVRVIKSADRYSVTAGESLTYTIAVSNGSSVTATNIVVTDTLPPGVEYVDDTDACVKIAGVLSCTIPGLLPPGSLAPFMIEVDVAPDAYDPDNPQICNNVWVSATTESGEGDTDLSDNHDEECTPLYEEADLAIDKESLSGDVVPIGEWFTYTLSLRNLGPSNSRVPVIMDWFATDGSLSLTASEGGMCGPMPTDQGWAEAPAWLMTWLNAICQEIPSLCGGDGFPWLDAWWDYWYETFPPMYPYPLAVDWMCVWNLSDVEPGDQIDVTVSALPLDPQTIYNQAWALPDMYPFGWEEDYFRGTFDPDFSNNMVELVTQVTEEADLSVVKFSKPDVQVDAGQPFTYTIFVENLGPAPAQNVSIRDETLSSGSFQVVDVVLDPNRADDGPFSMPSPLGGVTMEFDLNEPLEPKGIENQGRWVIQIVMQAAETQDVNNMVQVFTREGGSLDPDLSNNQDEDSIAVGDVADLWLDKQAAPYNQWDEYLAGSEISYTLHVHNVGPSRAENVVIEDLLPAGLTVTYVEEGPGSCTTGIPGDPLAPLTCNVGSLAPGDGAIINVHALIDPDYMGALENDAVVSSDMYDPDNSDNRASVIVGVETEADLTLDKEAPPPGRWSAGEIHTYRYNITNSGPSVSRDVRLRDFLPGEVEFVSAYAFKEGSTGGIPLPCNASSANVLICPLGDIPPTDPPGVAVLVDVYVKPDVPDGYQIWNDADLITDTYDPDGADDSIGKRIQNEPDLSVWKEADPWKVYAGEQVMYTIRVTNHGPGNAYDVEVDDDLPEEVDFELVTDPDCEDDDGEIECDWDMLGVGETRTFYIFGRVDPAAEPPEIGPWTVTNSVEVWADETEDPFEPNNYASAPNFIQGRADLRVQKFGKPDGLVRAGDKLTYTIIVDNLGTGYAHNVTLDDLLESNGSFDLLGVTSARDMLCDEVAGTFVNELLFTCVLTDPLEVKGPEPGSGRWMLTITVQANEPQSINNRADADSSDFDPDMSNNWDIAEHEITAVADLELTKGAMGEVLTYCDTTELLLDEVAAGGMVTYTLTVSNTGHSTAENVVLLDEPLPLPYLLEIDVRSIHASQGRCQTAHVVDQQRLKCNLGTIEPDGAATVTFVAHVPSWVPDGTVLVNDAQVYSDMFDDNNGNDIVSNQTVVSRVADLEVGKTQDPKIALPGQDITYTIVVTNTGPSDAQGVIISDTLPVEVLNATWTCCASDGECDVPCEPPVCPPGECPWPDIGLFAQADIPADEWVIYTIEGTMDVWPCPLPITNTVEIIAPLSLVHVGEDIDPCDGNNVAEAVNKVPFCTYDPLVLKQYPGPDSPP